MSLTDLETLYDTYAAAVDAESWDTALATLSKIAVRIATTPSKMARSVGNGGRQEMELNGQFVSEQQAFCRKMKAAAAHASSGPFVQVPVTYTRPTDTGDYR